MNRHPRWWASDTIHALAKQLAAWWPDDTAVDWVIGDTKHSHRKSDHNPDRTSKPPGVVRAIDITHPRRHQTPQNRRPDRPTGNIRTSQNRPGPENPLRDSRPPYFLVVPARGHPGVDMAPLLPLEHHAPPNPRPRKRFPVRGPRPHPRKSRQTRTRGRGLVRGRETTHRPGSVEVCADPHRVEARPGYSQDRSVVGRGPPRTVYGDPTPRKPSTFTSTLRTSNAMVEPGPR